MNTSEVAESCYDKVDHLRLSLTLLSACSMSDLLRVTATFTVPPPSELWKSDNDKGHTHALRLPCWHRGASRINEEIWCHIIHRMLGRSTSKFLCKQPAVCDLFTSFQAPSVIPRYSNRATSRFH